MQSSRRGFFASALLLAWVMVGSATAAAPGDDACLTCHGSHGIARDGGGSVFVSATEMKSSVHGGIACVTCHAAASAIPHSRELPPPRCGSCHLAAGKALAAGAHGHIAAGQG